MKGKGKLKILSGKLRCKNVSKNFSNKKRDYKCPNVKENNAKRLTKTMKRIMANGILLTLVETENKKET